jgi:O-antigen ligase
MKYLQNLKHIASFEVALLFFLFAGQYKTAPALDFVPVDITALTFGVSMLAGGWVILKRGIEFDRKATILTILIGLFVWYGLLSLGWSPSTVYAKEKGLFLVTLTVWPFLALTHVVGPDPQRLRRFVVGILLFSGWIATVSLLVYVSGSAQGGQQISAFGREAGYIGLGRIVGLGALVALVYALRLADSRLIRWISGGIFALYMFLLLVIGSRAAFIATAIPALFPFLIGIRWRQLGVLAFDRYVVPYLVGSVGGAIAVALLFRSEALSTISRLAYLIRTGGESQPRFELWEQTLRIWAENPIFGTGLAGWPIKAGFGDYLMYPHNMILEIMSELGIVGLILFGLFAGYALMVFWNRKSMRTNAMALLILMLLSNTFLNAMSTGDISHNRIVFGMVGLLLFRSPSDEQSSPRSTSSVSNSERNR